MLGEYNLPQDFTDGVGEQLVYLLIEEKKAIEHTELQLMIAEAVAVGTMASSSQKGHEAYTRWRTEKLARVTELQTGEKVKTIAEALKERQDEVKKKNRAFVDALKKKGGLNGV